MQSQLCARLGIYNGGYIAGRTTVRVNNSPLGDGATIGFAPILGADTRGVRVAIVF